MPGRVAFVIDELEIGGSQRQLRLMASGLASRGWDVQVVCLRPVLAMAAEFEEAGVPVRLIVKRRRLDFELLGALRRFFLAERIDLVHAFSSTAEFFGGLAARWAGCAFVASLRNVSEPLPVLHRAAKHLIALLADAIVANSRAARDEATATGLTRREKVHVIPNALDLRQLTPKASARQETRERLQIPPEAPVIALVGRLVEQKGYGLAIRIAQGVLSTHPAAVFVVAGDGPLKESLTKEVRQAGIAKRFLFLGERDDVPSILAAADLYLSTSHWEGMSNALMEAMGMGLPVVASAVGGSPELIQEAETGFLFPPDDGRKAVERVGLLLADPRLRQTLGERSQKRIRTEYSAEALISRLDALYHSLRPVLAQEQAFLDTKRAKLGGLHR